MHIPDFLVDSADTVTAIASLLGAMSSVYLAKLTQREHYPWMRLQQASLCLLAIALLANGLYVFPDWELINGHRPTGILVEAATATNMIVMAARGYLKYYG